jgi:hypothetical protein
VNGGGNGAGAGVAKLAVIGLFAAAVVGAFVFLLLRRGSSDPSPATSVASEPVAQAPESTTTITFLYSTEKQNFIEQAAAEFQKLNPTLRVELKGRGSLDAVADILEGREKPTLFSPADDVAMNLLVADWQQKSPEPVVATSGEDAAQPLVVTPLVFVAWEDRGNALAKGTQELTWQRIHEALGSSKGWPAIGGSADWGFVKLGHTSPARSNSGLQALLLMAYDYHDKRTGLEIKDILDEKFQTFVKTIERGVPKFGDSTGTFMKDMVLYGPSKYDVVVTYENLAIQSIPNAQGRWGNLRVFYPKLTMWSSHPLAVLHGNWVTNEQRAGARKFVAFLRQRSTQYKALHHGFRPADPSIPIIDNSPDNPFNAAKAFGVRVSVPMVAESPPGPVIRNLLEMWNRVIGRP